METNMLRRLNWLWKHRHTHDDDDDCCAQIAELRLQVETAADIKQHTTAGAAVISPEDWETATTLSETTHTLPVPSGVSGDLGMALVRFTQGTDASTYPASVTKLASNRDDPNLGIELVYFWYDDLSADTTFTTAGALDTRVVTWRVPQPTDGSLAAPVVAGGWGTPVSNGYVDCPAISPPTAPGLHWVFPMYVTNATTVPTPDLTDYDISFGDTVALLGIGYRQVDVVTSEDPPQWWFVPSTRGARYGTAAVSITLGVGELATPDDIITDHGELDGLVDDDHTQYLLADGSRALAGEWSAGSNKITDVTDPTSDQDAATKKYVDDNAVGVSDHGALTGLVDDDHTQYVKADGTRAFSGAVSGVAPTVAAHLATKAYVDGLTGPTAGGRWEVIVSGSAPPVAVTNEAEDDWIYGWVSD